MASQLSDNVDMGAVHVPLVNKTPAGVVRVSELQATSERSIDDILKQETLVSSFSITPDVEVGSRLESFVVNPKRIHPPGGSSRISFMANLFQFWKGMITLRLVFTKTILQQMKVAVLFVPGAKIDDPTPSKSEIMMYSHKQIINPSNEVEVTFDIPFISDRPFLRMDEDTGVVYFILFQPFTASVDPTNIITCDIFASSTSLKFHEFGIIPTLDPLGFSLPNDLMFLLSETSSNTVTFGANSDFMNFTSDLGQTVTGATYTTTEDISWCTDGKALGAGEYVPPNVYDPSIHRTIWGEPEPGYAGMSRNVWYKLADGVVCHLIFHFSNRGCYFGVVAAANSNQFFGPMSELSRNLLGDIHLDVSLVARVQELEDMVRHLLGQPRNLDALPNVSDLVSIFENRGLVVVDHADIKDFEETQCPLCGTFCPDDAMCSGCENMRVGGKVVHVCSTCDNLMTEEQKLCYVCHTHPYRMFEKVWLFRSELRYYKPVIVEYFPNAKTELPFGFGPVSPDPESDDEEEGDWAFDSFDNCHTCGSTDACTDDCDCWACVDNPIDNVEERVADYLAKSFLVPKPGTTSLDLGITLSEVRRIYAKMIFVGYITENTAAIGEQPNLWVQAGWRWYRLFVERMEDENFTPFEIPKPHHYA